MQMSENDRIRLRRITSFAIALIAFVAIFTAVLPNNCIKDAENYVECPEGRGNSLSVIRFDDNLSFAEVDTPSKLTDDIYVRVSGEPIGIAITARGLIVVAEGGVQTEDGERFPARDIGIKKGDIIKTLGGESVSSVYQLKKILGNLDSKSIQIGIERDGKVFEKDIYPAKDKISGQYKLGVALKEDVGGIGTLTFVTEKGQFGALGHYISDAESGLTEELDGGNIYKTSVDEVIRGEIGKAGGLVASVNRLSNSIGKIESNTGIGVYGVYTAQNDGRLVRVAMKGEAKPGRAQVLTTVEGDTPKFYDVEIVKVVSQTEPGDKGMVILVRDKELLQKTGGIVQGMSGSPILQNGVLIGAVTHVFIQDPTRGYAVHARFMLGEAEKISVDSKKRNNGNLIIPNIEDIDLAA